MIHKPLSAEDLAVLTVELAREELQIYTAVVLARRDLEAGNADAAIARLRVDADKLRVHCTPILRMLSGR